MNWIPITDRLPDETGAYLVTVKSKGPFGTHVIVGQWEQPEGQLTFDSDNKGKWKWMGQHEVIAWMPLPKPFEAKSEMDCPWK